MFPTVARGNKKKKNDNGQKVTNARTLATETPGYNSNGVSRRDSPLAAFVAASRESLFTAGGFSGETKLASIARVPFYLLISC